MTISNSYYGVPPTLGKEEMMGSPSNIFSAAPGTAPGNVVRMDQQLSPFRNKIINGDMKIDQINAGNAVTPSANQYIIDQWDGLCTVASRLTYQQVADAPTGFKYSLKVSVAGLGAYIPLAPDRFTLSQRIEGQNLTDLNFGTASGSSTAIAVSFWVKGSIPGTYSADLVNPSGSLSYVFNFPVTTSWTKQTAVITPATSGSWPTDNTTGLILRFNLGAGTNWATTVNAWQAGDFLRTATDTQFINNIAGSSINFTGVQIEKVPVGATSGTEFEHVPYQTQLSWCQRYYEKSYDTEVVAGSVNDSGMSNMISPSSGCFIPVTFKVMKRVAPSILLYSPVTGATSKGRNYTTTTEVNASLRINGKGQMVVNLNTTVAAGNDVGVHWSAMAQM